MFQLQEADSSSGGGEESVPANQVPNSCNHSFASFFLLNPVLLLVESSDSLSALSSFQGRKRVVPKRL
jgi:hypothetical protein